MPCLFWTIPKTNKAYEIVIGDKQEAVDVRAVCCASRFFELRAMLSEAREFLALDGTDSKALAVEFGKFVFAFGPISSSLQQIVEGLFISDTDVDAVLAIVWNRMDVAHDGCRRLLCITDINVALRIVWHLIMIISGFPTSEIKTRLQAVLQRANEMGDATVTKFTANLNNAYEIFAKQINSAAADPKLTEFSTLSASQEQVKQNKTKLVELASAEEASTIMNLFQVSSKLITTITSLTEATLPSEAGIFAAYKTSLEKLGESKALFNAGTEGAGRLLGHMCIVQSVFRSLEAGETRQSLIQKCRKSFQKKAYLKYDPHMWMVMDAEHWGGGGGGILPAQAQ